MRPLLQVVLLGPLASMTSACGSTADDHQARPPAPSGAAAVNRLASVEAGRTGTTAPSAVVPATPAEEFPLRTALALGREAGLVEWRTAGGVFVEGGTENVAGYVLGGWRMPLGRAQLVEGATVTEYGSGEARWLLPAASEGPWTLRARLGTASAGPVRLWVNGEEITSAPARGGGTLEVVEFAVPAGHVHTGDNLVLLRGPSRRTSGSGAPPLAVDWLSFTPAGEPLSPIGTLPSVRSPSTADGTGAALDLPTGFGASYYLMVPPSARLRARVQGANAHHSGELRVSVSGDELQPTELARVGLQPTELARVGPQPTELARVGPTNATTPAVLDVDLATLAGRVVRLDFESVDLGSDAGLSILDPCIVVPTDRHEVSGQARNVIVFLIDTLRADKIAPINPNTRVRTPAIDDLAAHGTTFTRAHSHENWTKPSCASVLSGLLPWQHTAVDGDSVLPASVEILPELLGARGYSTGAFIANGYVSDKFGFKQGWDTYRNYIREGLRSPAQYVADDVLAWLERRPADKPFFLYVHTIDPHVPYRPPQSFLSLYDEPGYAGPVSFARDATLLEKIKLGQLRLNDIDKRHLAALYDAEISYHDAHFARILGALAEHGLDRDTLVIVTADHGEEFWDHGSVGHGHSVFEELIHVPLLVRMPGQTAGRRIDAPVGHADIAPTIFDALGITDGPPFAGRSLLPVMRGEDSATEPAVVSGFMDGWRTVVTSRFKLAQRTPNHPTLYDLASDPGEVTDLVASHPITLRYTRLLLAHGLREGDRNAQRTSAASAAGSHSPPSTPQAERTAIDPATEAQLRALGYVGNARR